MKTVLQVVASILCLLGSDLLAQNPFYGPPQLFPVQAPGSDFRSVDIDGDGNLDVVVLSDFGVEILFGDGTGRLVSPTRLPSLRNVLFDFTIGDFNGDGVQDFVTFGRTFGSRRGFLDIYLSAGDRQWNGPSLAIRLTSFKKTEVTALDSNGDGFSDLAVVRGASLRSYVNRGNATFKAQPALGAAANEIRVMDFNQDTTPDLVVLNNGKARVFFGRGNGRFRKGPALNARASAEVVIADVNTDGFLDIVSLRNNRKNGRSSVFVTLARSVERLAPERMVLEPVNPYHSLHVADTSGDGIPDIILTQDNFTPGTRAVDIFHGLGNGLQFLFASGVGMQQLSTRSSVLYVRDVNFDSVEDLLLVESTNAIMTAFLGFPDGFFDSTPNRLQLGDQFIAEDSIIWADMNGDNREDMLIKGRASNPNIHVLLATAPAPPE